MDFEKKREKTKRLKRDSSVTKNGLNVTSRNRFGGNVTDCDNNDGLIEDALLGCILINPNIINQMNATNEDFTTPENRKIFEAMLSLYADGEDLAPIAIANRLNQPSYIKRMIGYGENILNAKEWKGFDQKLVKRGIKAKVLDLGHKLINKANNGESPDTLLSFIQDMSSAISAKIKGKTTLALQIDEWIKNNSGNTFYVTDCDKDLGIVTKHDRDNRRQILNRLLKKGILAKASNRQGHYRIVDDSLEVINFKEANANDILDIRWPFDIQKLVNLLPKSVVIVAGAWESGKTAFLLNVARMNMHRNQVRYMSSEMGDAEFALRLKLFTEMAADDWKIEAIERSADWEDAILPDGINIIDYLEQSDAFYNVGDKIRRIFDRLKRGIAVIALQKAIGKDLGRGGDFTAEKARLYLSLDPGELTILKGKLWANPQVSPKNMTMKFKLWQGHKFVPQGEWYKKVKQ